MLLLAHAVAYFLHEYSHSFAAWLSGCKENPLLLDYGHLTLINILQQQEIDENVDYDTLFAAGKGALCTFIALAGVSANLVCYLLTCRVRNSEFIFWLAVMSAGNLWSYAPVRVITTHADMVTAARGLGMNVWAFFPLVTLPSVAIGWHCFTRLVPRFTGGDAYLTSIACTIYFIFFGGAVAIGGNYGEVPALFSILSVFLLLPLALRHLIPTA
jgi:hypothetical protein